MRGRVCPTYRRQSRVDGWLETLLGTESLDGVDTVPEAILGLLLGETGGRQRQNVLFIQVGMNVPQLLETTNRARISFNNTETTDRVKTRMDIDER